MSAFSKPWGIAGGWAIDLFLGKETRAHGDLEIAVFRTDQLELQRYLSSYHFQKVMNNELHSWRTNDYMHHPLHELHGREKNTGHALEILLNDSIDGEWVFRRDSRVRLPKKDFITLNMNGIPYVNPIIVLLYKAKHLREKDMHDVNSVLPHFTPRQRKCMRKVLAIHDPSHTWLSFI